MKLTERQKSVVKDLQTGGVLITSSEMRGAIVGFERLDGRKEYHINNRVFWNLVDKGIINQGGERERFNYILTTLGREVKI